VEADGLSVRIGSETPSGPALLWPMIYAAAIIAIGFGLCSLFRLITLRPLKNHFESGEVARN